MLHRTATSESEAFVQFVQLQWPKIMPKDRLKSTFNFRWPPKRRVLKRADQQGVETLRPFSSADSLPHHRPLVSSYPLEIIRPNCHNPTKFNSIFV